MLQSGPIGVTVDGKSLRGNVMADPSAVGRLERLTVRVIELPAETGPQQVQMDLPPLLAQNAFGIQGGNFVPDPQQSPSAASTLGRFFSGQAGESIRDETFRVGEECVSSGVRDTSAGMPVVQFDCSVFALVAAPGWFASRQPDGCFVSEDHARLMCAVAPDRLQMSIALIEPWGQYVVDLKGHKLGQLVQKAIDRSSVAVPAPTNARPTVSMASECELPQWQIAFKGYCADRFGSGQCVTEIEPVSLNQAKLPSLAEAGWNAGALPNGFEVEIEHDGSVIQTAMLPIVGADRALADVLDNLDRSEFDLRIDFANGMRGQRFAELQFFSDSGCTEPAPIDPVAYELGYRSSVVTRPCLFAQVREQSGRVLSTCERVGFGAGSALVRVAPLTYGDRRKMVLLAQTRALQAVSLQLRDGFEMWLSRNASELGEQREPLTIATIDETGRIDTVLRAEDLRRMNATDIKLTVNRLMNFQGAAQRPLRDLADLDFNFPNSLASILYVIDDSLPERSEIRGAEIGAPLLWNANEIPLSIITTGSCEVWESALMSNRCWQLNRDTASDIASMLEVFLEQ